jgi:hypothetical protein
MLMKQTQDLRAWQRHGTKIEGGNLKDAGTRLFMKRPFEMFPKARTVSKGQWFGTWCCESISLLGGRQMRDDDEAKQGKARHAKWNATCSTGNCAGD